MTLFKFDDTSLDATRRSIFLYAFISFVVYFYNPTWDLEKGLGKLGFTFEKAEVTSHSIAGAMLVVLVYLFIRFLMLLPLHRSAKNREFRDLRDRVETHYEKIHESQVRISKRQDSLNDHLKGFDPKEIGKLLKQNQLDWAPNVRHLVQRLQETSSQLQEYLDRRPIAAETSKLDVALRESTREPENRPDLSPGEKLFLETEILKQLVELQDALSRAKPCFSIVDPEDPLHKQFAETREREKDFIEQWNALVEKELSQVPASFYSEDVGAQGRSKTEIRWFGTFVPLAASTLGMFFAIQAFVNPPSDQDLFWSSLFLPTVALLHYVSYFLFGMTDPGIDTENSQQEQADGKDV
jgi:hypothetical protein